MYPRFLVTVGEDLEPLAVNVRVGQAVDTVAQAGRFVSRTHLCAASAQRR